MTLHFREDVEDQQSLYPELKNAEILSEEIIHNGNGIVTIEYRILVDGQERYVFFNAMEGQTLPKNLKEALQLDNDRWFSNHLRGDC